jgi:hypothetical protein
VVCAFADSRGIKPADTAISPTRSFRIFATFVSPQDEMCSPCATPGERGVVWGFPADALVRRGRVCAWYRVRTPRSTCWLHRLPVPSCRPVHPLVRQEIGSAPSPAFAVGGRLAPLAAFTVRTVGGLPSTTARSVCPALHRAASLPQGESHRLVFIRYFLGLFIGHAS